MLKVYRSQTLFFMSVVIFAWLMVSCRPAEQGTQLKWGHLDEVATDGSKAIQAGPNDKIELCGPQTENVSWALLTWMKSISREQRIASNIVPCNSGAKFKIQLTSQSGGMAQFPSAPAWTSGSTITFNAGIQPIDGSNMFKAILLHEMGHVVGLCDQYSGVDNCNSLHSSGQKVGDSIMGATNPNKLNLSQDDVTGAQKLAERSDVPANAQWGTGNLNTSTGGGGLATPNTNNTVSPITGTPNTNGIANNTGAGNTITNTAELQGLISSILVWMSMQQNTRN